MAYKDKKKKHEYDKFWRENHKKQKREANQRWYYKNIDKIRLKRKSRTKAVNLKYKFGVTLDEYNKMFMDQGGCCPICGHHQQEFKRSFAVDHNHKTGKIRGLLCLNCNALLGYAKDDPNILEKAIHYLKED